jgi:hypothetical protein
MKSSYNIENGLFDWFDIDTLKDLPYKSEDSPTMFHVGQSYESEPANKLICKKCGSDKFNVGKGCCFTAIRCANCEWEECVHDG